MKNLKKLGKLKLMPEKMLNHEELVNFKGGSGSICHECVDSAEIGCEVSCANPTNGMSSSECYVECVLNQASQCFDMYGDPVFGCV